jgi:hypothetical protein
MKRLLVSLLSLALVLLSLAPAASAATTYPVTYTGAANFVCDAASAYPVTSFGQFSCRGVRFYDANNVMAGYYYFMNFSRFLLYTVNGDVAAPLPGWGQNTGVTNITEPGTNSPGTFAFNWTQTDANNVVHTGSVSGTWKNFLLCGGRGCRWWAPELVTNSITLTN